jgi:hypothetical protein
MATVAKSDYVLSQMMERVDKLFEKRIERASEDFNGKTLTQIGDLIYEKLVTDKVVQIMQDVNSEVMLHHASYSGPIKPLRESQNIKLEFNLGVNMFPLSYPRLVPTYLSDANTYYMANIKFIPHGETILHEVIELLKHRNEQISLVVTARTTFKNALRNAWTNVANVNQLIKVWPQAESLLEGVKMYRDNELVLDKIRRKVERNTVKKLESDGAIDVSALNAQLLMAKVAR